jgi:hypothetical protein
MNSEKISFTAKIMKVEGMNAGYVEFPYNVEEVFGTRGQVKIKAVFDNHIEYRGSLANMGMACHILILTKEIRTKINKTFGEMVSVLLEADTEIREVAIPEDVQSVLNENPEALAFFEKLAYTHRKEYIRWITDAKREETRLKRIETFVEKLLAKKKPDQN